MVSDDTEMGLVGPDPLPAAPPFDEVHNAVKPVIGLPPLAAGAVKVTDTDPLPAVAVPIVGAPGTLASGTTAFDGADGGPVPTPFVAVTVQV